MPKTNLRVGEIVSVSRPSGTITDYAVVGVDQEGDLLIYKKTGLTVYPRHARKITRLGAELPSCFFQLYMEFHEIANLSRIQIGKKAIERWPKAAALSTRAMYMLCSHAGRSTQARDIQERLRKFREEVRSGHLHVLKDLRGMAR